MDFLLSILIPTLPEREKSLVRFIGAFEKQSPDVNVVELLIDKRKARNKGGPTIAAKRNDLYKRAKGLFSVQIDDDDSVSPNYLSEILHAIRNQKGIQAIEHEIAVRSRQGNSLANVSIKNKEWRHGTVGRYKYHQPIYYKVPILTEICRKCKMDEKFIWREDADFAQKLKKHIKKTHRINKPLYIYNDPGNVNINVRY